MLGVPLTDPDRDPNCGSFLLQHRVHERGRERPPESASRMEPPYLHHGIEASVTAHAQVCARDIVANGGWQDANGNAKLLAWWWSRASANRTALSKAGSSGAGGQRGVPSTPCELHLRGWGCGSSGSAVRGVEGAGTLPRGTALLEEGTQAGGKQSKSQGKHVSGAGVNSRPSLAARRQRGRPAGRGASLAAPCGQPR